MVSSQWWCRRRATACDMGSQVVVDIGLCKRSVCISKTTYVLNALAGCDSPDVRGKRVWERVRQLHEDTPSPALEHSAMEAITVLFGSTASSYARGESSHAEPSQLDRVSRAGRDLRASGHRTEPATHVAHVVDGSADVWLRSEDEVRHLREEDGKTTVHKDSALVKTTNGDEDRKRDFQAPKLQKTWCVSALAGFASYLERKWSHHSRARTRII